MSQHIKTWLERRDDDGGARGDGYYMKAYIADLEAALARRYRSGKVAEGWKLMPPDATEAMMHAAEDLTAPRPYGAVYRAMFAAAPAADSAATEQAEQGDKFAVGVSVTDEGAQVAIHLKRDGITHVVYSQHHPAGRETAGIGYLPAERSDSAAEPSEADIERMVLAVKHDGLASTDFEYVKRVFKAGMRAAAPASADVGELPEAAWEYGAKARGMKVDDYKRLVRLRMAAPPEQSSSAALPKERQNG